MTEDRLAFALTTLVDAEHAVRPISVCRHGHLVVAARSHWQPEAFTADLRKLTCLFIPECNG